MINDAFVNLVHLDLKSNLTINCRHKRIVVMTDDLSIIGVYIKLTF